MSQHTRKKPTKEWPFFWHPTGGWCKKIRGKLVYFGKDDQKAIDRWCVEKDELLAGRTPRKHSSHALQLHDLCNRFLTSKEKRVASGELRQRSFYDYLRACKIVTDAFGRNRFVDDLTVEDFDGLRSKLAKTRGPVALGNEIQRIRVVFKWGVDNGLIAAPMRYGQAFNRPSARSLRIEKSKKGARLFAARHIRRLLKEASVPMRAMILLGINCGLGNSDCGNLCRRHVDLRHAWLDFPRPKTGVARRAKLWPSTVQAIEKAIVERPHHKDEQHASLLFITKQGRPWGKEIADSPVTKEFRKMLDALDLHREGLGFYSLRHTFRTVADAARDRGACDYVMGHNDGSMASIYVEQISDDRLVAVAEHVHRCLFRMTTEQWKTKNLP